MIAISVEGRISRAPEKEGTWATCTGQYSSALASLTRDLLPAYAELSVKRPLLKIVILLWMGWYVWGPVDPVVDFWDTPRQEMSDMVRAAGGTVVLIAAGFALALLQFRNLGDRLRLVAHSPAGVIGHPSETVFIGPAEVPSLRSHGPPIPLRI